jgi:hypothetical protein
VSVTKFALEPALVDPFEGNGLRLDRLVCPDDAGSPLGFQYFSRARRFTIDTSSGQLIFRLSARLSLVKYYITSLNGV